MDDTWARFTGDLTDRLDGPMKIRFILQPAMSGFFAIRSGLKDAKLGRPPYFWAFLNNASHRARMLEDGWKDVGKVFVLALVLDVVYQFKVLKMLYPFEALLVALLLAIVPYLLLRGVTTRAARKN